jgi:hypothetical protein
MPTATFQTGESVRRHRPPSSEPHRGRTPFVTIRFLRQGARGRLLFHPARGDQPAGPRPTTCVLAFVRRATTVNIGIGRPLCCWL